MADLVLATVVSELKMSWGTSISNENLINLLYDVVSIPAGLYNKKGETISVSKTVASYIVNRQPGGNVNQQIREHSQDDAVLKSIPAYFQEKIVSQLLKGSRPDLLHRLTARVKTDSFTSPEKKEKLLSYAKEKKTALFLAGVYLQSLQPPNVLSEEARIKAESKKDDAKCHPLDIGEISDEVGITEKRYTDALKEIYAEQTNMAGFQDDDFANYPSWHRHFIRQRRDYWAAEAIRRGTRDIYGDEEEEYFTILTQEIFDGVIDVWEAPYNYGIDRLRDVLQAAIQTPVNQCWLSKDTVWIGNSQKKGVCHVLVNEGRIDGWVKKDGETV